MVSEELFNDKVLRACTRAANRVTRTSRNYCEHADILSEMYVWVAKHPRNVTGWLDEGQHGLNKMNVALYRAGHEYVAKERARRTGAKTSDFYWYTPAVIMELLPDVWEYSNWASGGSGDQSMPRGKSKPSEGNNRQAMMVDVAYALSTLPQDDRVLLANLYAHGGMNKELLAAQAELTVSGLEKRVGRIVDKMVERLGGEPPFWKPGRKARSNASVQADTRKADQ